MQFPKRVFSVKHFVTSLVSTCIYLREEQKCFAIHICDYQHISINLTNNLKWLKIKALQTAGAAQAWLPGLKNNLVDQGRQNSGIETRGSIQPKPIYRGPRSWDKPVFFLRCKKAPFCLTLEPSRYRLNRALGTWPIGSQCWAFRAYVSSVLLGRSLKLSPTCLCSNQCPPGLQES